MAHRNYPRHNWIFSVKPISRKIFSKAVKVFQGRTKTQDQDKIPLFLLNMAESFIYIAQFVDGSNWCVEPYFFK